MSYAGKKPLAVTARRENYRPRSSLTVLPSFRKAVKIGYGFPLSVCVCSAAPCVRDDVANKGVTFKPFVRRTSGRTCAKPPSCLHCRSVKVLLLLGLLCGFLQSFFCAYILVWSTSIVLSSLGFLLLVLTGLAPLVGDPKLVATFLIFPLSEQFPVDFGAACH
jgi:hypothetical protein